jgi:type IV pilus assembly protein PilY1
MNMGRVKQLSVVSAKALLAVSIWAGSSTSYAQLGPDQATAATERDYAVTPELLANGADPLLMIDLSVELTQQGESYTGATEVMAGGNICPGRQTVTVGGSNYSADICYTSNEEYIGYFDPSKCYQYNNGGNAVTTQDATSPHAAVNPEFFFPSSLADSNYECSGAGEFSGNFMNWASMTAIDQFRGAMTGGARLVDTFGSGAQTLLTRTHRYNDWGFAHKVISSGGLGGTTGGTFYSFSNTPNRVTPFSSGAIRVNNRFGGMGNRLRFYDSSNTFLGEYSVIVQVCDDAVSLENNCVAYTDGTNTWYKPEGLLIQNALKMKYGLFSYLADNSHQRNGGVLRVAAKYIGTQRPTVNGGFETNPEAEIDTNGVIVLDPDGLASATPGVNNSGLLNYINNFGLGNSRYKSYDPVAELYYESLRYLVSKDGVGTQLSPTLEYYNNLTLDMYDNFPVITTWTDPITEDCQANYVLYSGDQYAWEDHNLPGVSSAIYDWNGSPGVVNGNEGNPHQPSSTGIGINADTLTDTVGTLEGYFAGTLGGRTRGRNNNGWWFAGLSYWANTTDIRSDRSEAQVVRTFVVDTQEYQSGGPGTGVGNPLWLAAKYGGFETGENDTDLDPNTQTIGGTSTTTDEDWDEDGDGTPDTYTLGNQPANMVAGLSNVFDEVANRVASGSAAAVQAGSSRGIGGFYQALYEPQIVVDSDAVLWSGNLYAWFIDADGVFYEDTCNNLVAVGPSNCDKVFTADDAQIRTRFDVVAEQLMVDRYSHDGSTFLGSVSIRNVSALWSAQDELAALTNVTTQRTFSSSADGGRYIFTWIDSDQDGSVASGEQINFDDNRFTGSSISEIERYLGLDSSNLTIAPDIVNYIRGEEGAVSGWRTRTIDANGDGTDEALRLGDIVHSSPLAVGRPEEDYSTRYSDTTYTAFRQQYRDRRVMIYAGANDGMLHAFNGGFYDEDTNGFQTQTGAGETSHPLGSEIWAYVPQNLLPHLRWLTQTEYSHVYYVDGSPESFDVNIFPDDADHPGGWGTILVVGFRLGGGDQTIDLDSDTDGDLSDDVTFRSAFVVLDITNPEIPPTLLAEITDPGLGFATSEPSVFKNRKAGVSGSFNAPLSNQWYLALGSGPGGATGTDKDSALIDMVSNQNAQVFVVDLNTLVSTGTTSVVAYDSGESTSFIGGLSAVDWDGDYDDDTVYFGTVGGTVASPSGNLRRLRPGGSFSTLLTGVSGRAFAHTPVTVKDAQNNHWVFGGTGRLLAASDLATSDLETFYAIKEPLNTSGSPDYSSVAKSNLEDVTDIRVFSDGVVTNTSGTTPITVNGLSVSTFSALELALRNDQGWFREFSPPGSRTTQPPTVTNDALFITVVHPDSGSVCEVSGDSFIYLLDFSTGTPSPNAYIGTDSTVTYGSAELLDLYQPEEDSIIVGTTAVKDGVVITEDDAESSFVGGNFSSNINGRMSWRELFLN